MSSLLESVDPQLREWVAAIAAFAIMFLAAMGARLVLRSRQLSRYGGILSELSAPISNLIVVFGLRFFTELAPLNPKLAEWLGDGLYVIGVFIMTFLLRRGLMLSIDWGAQKSPRSSALQQGFVPLMKNVVTIVVFFMATIFVMKRFGQDIMSLLTALGVGSLAVGLAAKDTLANMIAGFTLVIDRNLKNGDKVNLGGTVGLVEEIGLRSTRIYTGDGNILIVPNAELVNTKILNLSLPTSEGTVSGEVRVSVEVPFQSIRTICLAAMDEIPSVRKDRGRWANLKSLADGHQLVQFGFWVADAGEAGAVLSQVQESLLKKMRADQIRLHSVTAPPPAL